LEGRPIPAENSPRRVFERLFRGDRASLQSQRDNLQRRIKLVDAVVESARSLDRQLGNSDRERMDQYLTSLNEVESRLIASERWIDVPLKKQDYSHLNLDATPEGEPAEYYRNMFDLIALAFDADITRSVAFMLNREDGMGISDTFPLKLGLSKTHHNLSHAADKDGQLQFARYDLFLSQQVAHFFERLTGYQDRNGSVLDNTIVLFGSGAEHDAQPSEPADSHRRWRLHGPEARNLLEKGRDADVERVPHHSAISRRRAGVVCRQHRNAQRIDLQSHLSAARMAEVASQSGRLAEVRKPTPRTLKRVPEARRPLSKAVQWCKRAPLSQTKTTIENKIRCPTTLINNFPNFTMPCGLGWWARDRTRSRRSISTPCSISPCGRECERPAL
jgi:hypothetical protein